MGTFNFGPPYPNQPFFPGTDNNSFFGVGNNFAGGSGLGSLYASSPFNWPTSSSGSISNSNNIPSGGNSVATFNSDPGNTPLGPPVSSYQPPATTTPQVGQLQGVASGYSDVQNLPSTGLTNFTPSNISNWSQIKNTSQIPNPMGLRPPPGGSNTNLGSPKTGSPASTQASTTQTGLRDMSGQTWGALNTVIPQGWFMDQQGNWIYKGTGNPNGTQQQSGVTTLPASYVNTAFNPADTAANLKAGGYTQQPDGSWVNTTKAAQDWQTIYGSGQANTPGTSQNVAPPAGVASPTPATGTPITSNTNQYLQLLTSLFGNQMQQPSQVVKTPLGYTQYQSSVPQGSNALQQLILQSVLGRNTGGSQGSFWDLLGGGGAGGNSGGSTSRELALILSLLGGQ